MNPSKSGWVKEFVNYRKSIFSAKVESEKTHRGKNPDQSFYGIIQPTGIMYGYPVGGFGFDVETSWSDADRTKVLLLDSFINIAELYHEDDLTDESFEEFIDKTLHTITDFYSGVYPEISVSTKNWFGKRKSALDSCEEIFDKRVSMVSGKQGNFWMSFFSRSQLFLDIYIFGQWSHTKPDSILLDFFKSEKEELSFTSVKVIAAAAHANEHIEEEERSLFDHFIGTSSLPAEKKRVAHEYFEHGMGIQEIPIQDSDPWIIRKYFLEIGALTIWSDKRVEPSEQQFLEEFGDSLGFSKDDFEVSMIAVEGFILQNWNQLTELQHKVDYETVSAEYMEHLVKVIKKQLPRIDSNIANDHSLLATIKKGNAQILDEEEKELIRARFFAILQSIPNFTVTLLPSEFLTYENLLKVIPKETVTKVLDQE